MLRLTGFTQGEYLARSGNEVLEIAAPEHPHLRTEIAAALQNGELAEVTFRRAVGEIGATVRAGCVCIDGVSGHPLLLMLSDEAPRKERRKQKTKHPGPGWRAELPDAYLV